MRITNSIITHNAAKNINGNKANVDRVNQQMSSEKKIQRPSEDPVVAIRALRLRGDLNQLEQYNDRNIPDAESWLSVTDTALGNLKSILTTIRTQCEYGASDQITTDDRNTILKTLEKMRDQIYAEGNADYAGRTVFTGYRTNKKLTFMNYEADTSYQIKQKFSFTDLEEHRYYGNEVKVPKLESEILGNTISNPSEAAFERIRLGYGEIDTFLNEPGGAASTVQISYTDAKGENPAEITATVYETYEDWLKASGSGNYEIAANEAVVIRQSGEMIFSKEAVSALKRVEAKLEVEYAKTGFDKGEVRPEYYYDCIDVTNPDKPLEFKKYDDKGNMIYQDINYVVATNQTLTVNTQASSVFDSSIGRDVDEMIDAVKRSMDAIAKVDEIKEMMGMTEFASQECQARLKEWLSAAEKETAYADDNLQKLYNTYIGHFDGYLKDVLLARTDVGSKGNSLDLIKNRMENQQTTIEQLKSKNEDLELSDILIDYTAAYNAYTASLQAASKLGQVSLLNYL